MEYTTPMFMSALARKLAYLSQSDDALKSLSSKLCQQYQGKATPFQQVMPVQGLQPLPPQPNLPLRRLDNT